MAVLVIKSLSSPGGSSAVKDSMGQLELSISTTGGWGARLPAGWQWSKHVKPIAGTDSCLARTWLCDLRTDDGPHGPTVRKRRSAPADYMRCPPGHDAWVVGPEPCRSDRLAGIHRLREGLIRRVAGRDRWASRRGWSASSLRCAAGARGFGLSAARPAGRPATWALHRDVELRLAVLGPLRVQRLRKRGVQLAMGWPYRMCRGRSLTSRSNGRPTIGPAAVSMR